MADVICWKVAHLSKAAALVHARRAKSLPGRMGIGKASDLIIAYRCVTCSRWHVGHEPKASRKAEETRREARRDQLKLEAWDDESVA